MSTEKLASIESDVTGIRKRIIRSNQTSILIGTILLLLIIAYFVYGYRQINSVLVPKTIVDLAQTTIDDNIPTIKTTIKTEVEKNAPSWAQSLSQQAIDTVPQVRESLVNYTVDQTDQLVSQSVNMTNESFDEFVKTNRADIQSAITELKTNEEVPAELLDTIQDGFNKVLKADLEKDSEEILAYSRLMEDKMTRLISGKKLEPAEKLERQALMVLRRLQLAELKE